MISVICAYNNEQIFQVCLLKSLSEQKTDCEIIAINNTENRFKSAAEALNWGGTQAVGDYLMFVHQDVDLCSDSFFDGTEALLDSLPALGVAGVAGISERGDPFIEQCSNTIHHRPQARFRNVITQGPQKERWGTPIWEPEPVQTLDECLVIVPKSVFQMMRFDEVTCDGWHLYAVDYCLSVGAQQYSVYAIPKFVCHQSKGFKERSALRVIASLGLFPEEYYRTLERVLKKHEDRYKWIHTSCGSWNTIYPLNLQRLKHALKHVVLSLLFRS
jgi:Glycosyltransferase like family